MASVQAVRLQPPEEFIDAVLSPERLAPEDGVGNADMARCVRPFLVFLDDREVLVFVVLRRLLDGLGVEPQFGQKIRNLVRLVVGGRVMIFS